MSKAKPKKRPSSLRDSFIRVRREAANKRGYRDEWVYCGPWYRLRYFGGDAKKTVLLICLLTALEAALAVLGCLAVFEANHAFAVITFRLLSLIPLLFQIIGTLRLLSMREGRLTQMDWKASDRELRIAPWAYAALSLAVLIAVAVRLIRAFDALSLLPAFAAALGCGAAVLTGLRWRDVEGVRENNDVKRSLREINDKATGMGTGVYVARRRKN